MDDVVDQILQLEEQFQEKNSKVLSFFNKKIETEEIPEVAELFQFSLSQYLESMDSAEERFASINNPQARLQLCLDRDLYVNFLFDAYGIPKDTDDEKKK